MTLLDEAMEPVVMIEKRRVPDGEGGLITTWIDGAEFRAAITFDDSSVSRIAQAQGVTNVFTVTTKKTVVLSFHDVFRRISDGKTFRVTSAGEDNYTPASASLNMRQVSAEEWVLPA